MKAQERLRIAYKLAGELGMDSDKLQSEYAKMVEMIESANDFAKVQATMPSIMPNSPPPITPQPLSPTQPTTNALPDQSGQNAPILP